MYSILSIKDLNKNNELCPSWEIEDYLQFEDCFTNNGHAAHLDSYLTVFEFNTLDRCLREIKNVYTREQWKKVIEYWESSGYLSPNQLLLSKIARNIILSSKEKK